MNTRVFAGLALLMLCWSAHARSDSTGVLRKRGYFFSLHSGCLAGKTGEGTFFTSSLVQGWRIDRLAFGLGIGYDAYVDWRVMPVFLNASYDAFPQRGNALFFQMNAGLARAWLPRAPFEIEGREGANFHISPLAGYRISGNRFSLYISAGYKFQMLRYSTTWSQWGTRTVIAREIGRVCIQLGVGFR